MGVDLLKRIEQLPQLANSGLAETDLIPVRSGAVDNDGALPISELDKRYASQASGASGALRIARGVASVTGTATVATGLNTVVAVIATSQSDLDGVTIAAVSATVGNQSGSPAAGSVILKCWKATSNSNPTLIAATSAENVNWVAVGM